MNGSQTTAAQRLGIVLNWVQAICLVSGLTLAFALFTYFFLTGDDDAGAVGLLFLALGLGGAIVIGAIAFVVSSDFRILPATHRGPVKASLIGLPLLAILVIIGEQTLSSSDQADPDGKGSFDPTTAQRVEEPERAYELETLGARWGVTGRKTGLFMIWENHSSGGDSAPTEIFATVINGWFLATARWHVQCESGQALTNEVTCAGSGEKAFATFRVQDPEDCDSIHWQMDSSGYAVNEDFRYWPLNEARRRAVAFESKNPSVAIPDPRTVTNVVSYVLGD